MTAPHYDDGRTAVYLGDCIDVMRGLPDNSVDSIVTDPPYGLGFMGKAWDQFGNFASSKRGGDARDIKSGPLGVDHTKTRERSPSMVAGEYDRSLRGQVNFQGWCEAWARECLRVLKPGGHLLAFGGTRTWHRLAVAVEDAGFEMRDSIAWLYGSGFPKSMDVSKAIDKAAGATDAAREWQGWGTALKPAFEPVVVARKPLIGTVAANVLAHGTGALNIDGSRIPTSDSLGGGQVSSKADGWDRPWKHDAEQLAATLERGKASVARAESLGRWPANVILDESQAAALDAQSGKLTSGANPKRRNGDRFRNVYGEFKGAENERPIRGVDTGGASRFFYCAKASTSERPKVGSLTHATVKPLTLMRYLVRLVTPPGGVVLEPFAGSGTTVEACILEGFRVIGIEREVDYWPLIRQRIARGEGVDTP